MSVAFLMASHIGVRAIVDTRESLLKRKRIKSKSIITNIKQNFLRFCLIIEYNATILKESELFIYIKRLFH